MKKNTIIKYLKASSPVELFKEADEIRSRYCGEKVFIRGLIEFSNFCIRDCLYCGLRRSNNRINRYRMNPEEVLSAADNIIASSIKTVVLQSGDDLIYRQKGLCGIIERIKKKSPDTAVTLCVGERPFEDYRAFKAAGADRYLLRHETANRSLYTGLHPGQSLARRLKALDYLRRTGFQIGSGSIVGLPGQRMEDIADDILLLKRLQPDMLGIGPFMPQKDTPLSKEPSGDRNLTLRVLALARIVTHDAHMPVTTALASLKGNGYIDGLKSGCNVIMVNFTPELYRKNYIIYDNKTRTDIETAKSSILKSHRAISFEKGDSLKLSCKNLS